MGTPSRSEIPSDRHSLSVDTPSHWAHPPGWCGRRPSNDRFYRLRSIFGPNWPPPSGSLVRQQSSNKSKICLSRSPAAATPAPTNKISSLPRTTCTCHRVRTSRPPIRHPACPRSARGPSPSLCSARLSLGRGRWVRWGARVSLLACPRSARAPWSSLCLLACRPGARAGCGGVRVGVRWLPALRVGAVVVAVIGTHVARAPALGAVGVARVSFGLPALCSGALVVAVLGLTLFAARALVVAGCASVAVGLPALCACALVFFVLGSAIAAARVLGSAGSASVSVDLLALCVGVVLLLDHVFFLCFSAVRSPQADDRTSVRDESAAYCRVCQKIADGAGATAGKHEFERVVGLASEWHARAALAAEAAVGGGAVRSSNSGGGRDGRVQMASACPTRPEKAAVGRESARKLNETSATSLHDGDGRGSRHLARAAPCATRLTAAAVAAAAEAPLPAVLPIASTRTAIAAPPPPTASAGGDRGRGGSPLMLFLSLWHAGGHHRSQKQRWRGWAGLARRRRTSSRTDEGTQPEHIRRRRADRPQAADKERPFRCRTVQAAR